MNPGIDYYRPFGQQAFGTVQVLKMPSAGNKITLDGVDYAFGTDFGGDTVNRVAEGLAAAINSDRARMCLLPTACTPTGTKYSPVKSVFAIFVANVVWLIATQPGTDGNSITLTTDTSTVFTVSGATLTGGTTSGVGGIGFTLANKVTWTAIPTVAAAVVAGPIVGSSKPAHVAHIMAAATNGADLMIGSSGFQPIPIPAGTFFTLKPGDNAWFDLANIYFKSTNAGDSAHIIYV